MFNLRSLYFFSRKSNQLEVKTPSPTLTETSEDNEPLQKDSSSTSFDDTYYEGDEDSVILIKRSYGTTNLLDSQGASSGDCNFAGKKSIQNYLIFLL